MIKPLLISSSLSITEWAYRKAKPKSIPEWDELITTIENVDLLFTLVSDWNCPQRASVLKCLYARVGTSASKHVEADARSPLRQFTIHFLSAEEMELFSAIMADNLFKYLCSGFSSRRLAGSVINSGRIENHYKVRTVR